MDFTKSKDTDELWKKVLAGWRHANLPEGKRFLGSLVIAQSTSNWLLGIVGDNLRSHLRRGGSITYSSLCESFDVRKNWVRIITAALSEYAYYYSTSHQGFWRSFCEHEFININHSQGVEIALREITRNGIELLRLVRTRHGYTYVSTLWLQSGIPQRNLGHFAELVQGIANEYGWWEIAHTSERLLSQELLEFCIERHQGRNTLIGFLRVSCSDTEEVEPISGQLVQGIASVALELERNNQEADILRDENQRENILRNYYLPKHFFLRDWDNLIQVLTRTQRHRSSYLRTIKPRKKQLSMILDIFNTGNIQLVLPEQNLREPTWSALFGSYCHIPDFISGSIWQGNIPCSNSGFLIIPERIISIRNIETQWRLRLLDHNNRELVTWTQEGIADALPCLIFDANIGKHISLDAAKPEISRTNEIICFVSRDVRLKLNNEIDILSSYVPCSISDWYGQHIQLLSHSSEVILIRPGQYPPVTIKWQISDNQQPVLRGLKIKGRKEVYLEIPTLWHPPTSQNLSFNISVENLISKEIIFRDSRKILASDRWQSIPLDKMVATPSKYQIRLWNEAQQYSFSFELRSEHQSSEALNLNTLQIYRRKDNKDEIVESLPIQCDRLEQFWAEIITIRGLWTLEKVTLTLSNGDSKISYLVHADKSGTVSINVATLYGKLLNSDWYALDFQRSGMEIQRLVELSPQQPISYTWANDAIHLSRLQSNQDYSLVCWNLLAPHLEPEKIGVQSQGQETIAVPLSLSAGIYHIQIQGRSLQDLGCWCGDENPELPQIAEEDEDLGKYALIMLFGEATEDLIIASKHIAIDRKRFKLMLSSLQLNPCFFPDWLIQMSLQRKLEALLEISSDLVPIIKKTIVSQKLQPIIAINEQEIGRWYLVQIMPNIKGKNPDHNRNTFLDHLKVDLCKQEVRNLIKEAEIPKEKAYYNFVLIRLIALPESCQILQKIACFQKIETKPLTTDEVNRMLGRK